MTTVFLLFLSPIFPALAAEATVPVSQAEITLSFAPIVKKVAPAVVNIYTMRRERVAASPLFADPFFEQFFARRGMQRERVVASLGSGVIISDNGMVVTSNHVIDGASDIVAVLPDKREFKAKLLVADPSTDLALLKLETQDALPALTLADSDRLEVGDLVLAVGNPFAVGQTVTSGIVSALARSGQGVTDYDFFIQTDAAINPGNSGGALVTMRGELVGINTAIYSRSGGSLGIGFAIPSNMVRALMRNTGADGSVVRPWLGASYQEVTPEIAESLGLAAPKGALVAKVFAGSPAERAGLKVGDVIVGVGDVSVEDVAALKYRLYASGVNGETPLAVQRDGESITLPVKLVQPPEVPARDRRTLQGQHPLTGITVENLSPRVAVELGLDPEARGVIVSGGGSGYGVQPGDIIEQVNGKPVTSTKQLESIMQQRLSGWNIRLKRGGGIVNMAVRQ